MLPKSIGIVTSSTGSVIRDIINVAGRRNKNIKLVLFPVAVQGTQAAGQIAAAISKFNEINQVDVIIVARGGGSLEELWAFNEEIVARSIFASTIPVVSAVGHETDYTISDFASDVRAPTPSAAAELAVPDREMLLYKLETYNTRMKSALTKKLDDCNSRLGKIKTRPVFKQPYDTLYQKRLILDNNVKHLIKNTEMTVKDKKSQFCLLAGKLDALSPLKILERGYSVTRGNTGQTIKSIRQVAAGDSIEVEIRDGIIDCNVISVREDNKV
jgi:exodeoxyribonuclease VII large subunit